MDCYILVVITITTSEPGRVPTNVHQFLLQHSYVIRKCRGMAYWEIEMSNLLPLQC